MKLWAKLRLNGEKNANQLIRSFFEEFHPESSILIKGKEAEIEVVFEAPPMRTVDAIVHCDIIEFSYEKSNEYSKEKICIPEEQIEEAEAVTTGEQTNEEAEFIADEVIKKEAVNLHKQKVKNEEIFDIPELTEIAKNSSSYEDFVKSVLEWLKFGKKHEMFETIIKVAENFEIISWKNIKNELANRGVKFAKNEDISIASKFKTRFKDRKEPITPIPFIKAIIAYRTFDFDNSKTVEITENDDSKSNEISESDDSVSEIPCLSEIFISVDKNLPIEEKVTCILKSMGLNRLEYDMREMICKIANAAVITEENRMNIDFIMAKAVILPDKLMNARMSFSSLINDFVKENNCDQKIKLIDFLQQLKKAVIVKE